MSQSALEGFRDLPHKLRFVEEYKHLYVDLRTLKKDGQNPNQMLPSQKKALWKSLEKWSWVYPILTNRDGVVGNGEQRLDVCLEHDEYYGPVLKMDVSEVDRKLLRQVLNKLHGTHDVDLDALEFYRIVEQGRRKDLVDLAVATEKEIQQALNSLKEQESKGNYAGQDRADEETKLTKCPQCGYVFNPEQYTIDLVLEQWSTDHKFIETKPIEGKTNIATFDVKFSTVAPKITDKVTAVSESFGIGVDESQTHKVLQGVSLNWNDGDLIYVTGDSGGGKSTLLRLFKEHESSRGRDVRDFGATEVSNLTLIDGLPGNAEEAMGILNVAGLGEASLMIKRFEELSDGQRYRYRIAKLISKGAQTIVIDNFGDALDRDTAKVLSYNLQKWVRRKKITLIVATPHHDLIEDLNPNIIVCKGFGPEVKIEYRHPETRELSIARDVVIENGSKGDIESLERFHYLAESSRIIAKFVYRMRHRDVTIGVIVYMSPMAQLAMRNKIMPEYKGSFSNAEIMSKLNNDVIRISRVILHPKYRGTGLAVKLIKETMIMTGYPVVETLAAMARFNPVFEKAGMKLVGIMEPTKTQKKIETVIQDIGGDPSRMRSPTERDNLVKSLDGEKFGLLEDAVLRCISELEGKGNFGKNMAASIREKLDRQGLSTAIGELLGSPRAYLYWKKEST